MGEQRTALGAGQSKCGWGEEGLWRWAMDRESDETKMLCQLPSHFSAASAMRDQLVCCVHALGVHHCTRICPCKLSCLMCPRRASLDVLDPRCNAGACISPSFVARRRLRTAPSAARAQIITASLVAPRFSFAHTCAPFSGSRGGSVARWAIAPGPWLMESKPHRHATRRAAPHSHSSGQGLQGAWRRRLGRAVLALLRRGDPEVALRPRFRLLVPARVIMLAHDALASPLSHRAVRAASTRVKRISGVAGRSALFGRAAPFSQPRGLAL